jgi:chemotaxis protein methyltransferase CheR
VFHPADQDVELSEEEFRLLRDFIHERFGLYFDDGQRNSLRTRLVGRLVSLDLLSFEDYYHYLRFGPQRTDELERMISHLTNNETYFFREPAQLNVFASHVLRTVKERKNRGEDRSLRLVSAGCSTGEELLSLAMIVYDSGQFFWSWDVQLTGVDVDPDALERARKGVYFHNSFRALTPAQTERHFTTLPEGGAQAKEAIRRMVRFRQGNLLHRETYQDLIPFDVIFCRNVLIYFSDTTIQRAVRLFYDMLNPGGYLLLGHAESLSRITDIFTPIRFPGTMIYQKPERPEARS